MKKKFSLKMLFLTVMMLICICGMTAFAEGEDDNSLYALGITTEGAQVSPEFVYSTVEYNVTVPAGTQKLELEPVPSNSNAKIVDISGTELVDGKTTVGITVEAPNGNQYTYYLYVTAEEGAAQTVAPAETEPETEPATEPETEEETEPETEDPRYVKVDRESLEEAKITIENLKTETTNYRERVGILTKILYGMIGFCVVLLFIVINQLLKKRELKNELKAYRGYGYAQMPAENYANGQDYNGQAYGIYQNQSYGNESGYYQQDGYYEQQYSDQNAAQGYGAVQPEEVPAAKPVKEKKKAAKVRKAKKMTDDPNTVPKPEDARIQEKEMPAYQPQPQPTQYQQPAESSNSGIEVNMIDL